jgi:CHAD domain-containing protein
MREKEAKFEFEESSELPEPGTLVEGLGQWSVDEIRQNADYYDTADLRLTRAGASLRFRSDDGWTVKLPKQQDGLLERDEFVFGFEGPGSPPAEAVSLIRALSRSRPLKRVATLRTDRREVRIEDRKGRAIGLIDDDRVRTTLPGARTRSFHEVEFEIADGADSDLVAKVMARLREAGARPSKQRPKIVRALGEAARVTPDVVPGDPLGRTSTPADLAQSCLANSVHRLVTHDPVVRTDSDREGVHKARVATRRLRSDLRTLRPVLQTARTEPLRKELKWLGESLGAVRDAVVLQGLLTSKLAVLPAACSDDAASIEKELEGERATQFANLSRELDSSRYLAVLDDLVSIVHEPPLNRSHRDPTRTDVAAVKRLADKQWKRFRKAVDRLSEDPSDSELHEVRKREAGTLRVRSDETDHREARASPRETSRGHPGPPRRSPGRGHGHRLAARHSTADRERVRRIRGRPARPGFRHRPPRPPPGLEEAMETGPASPPPALGHTGASPACRHRTDCPIRVGRARV